MLHLSITWGPNKATEDFFQMGVSKSLTHRVLILVKGEADFEALQPLELHIEREGRMEPGVSDPSGARPRGAAGRGKADAITEVGAGTAQHGIDRASSHAERQEIDQQLAVAVPIRGVRGKQVSIRGKLRVRKLSRKCRNAITHIRERVTESVNCRIRAVSRIRNSSETADQ